MAIRLAAPKIETFHLAETDSFYGNEGDPTTVTIVQATQAQNERRAGLFDKVTRVMSYTDDEDEVKIMSRFNVPELVRMEVYLTMVDCNIEGEDGKPLFTFRKDTKHPALDMTLGQFTEAWGLLPPRIAREIHSKVREVNVTWRGDGSGE